MTLANPELYDMRTERIEMETIEPYGVFTDPSVPLSPPDNPRALLSPMVAVHVALAKCIPRGSRYRGTTTRIARVPREQSSQSERKSTGLRLWSASINPTSHLTCQAWTLMSGRWSGCS